MTTKKETDNDKEQVKYHWFFQSSTANEASRKSSKIRYVWRPFSKRDSNAIDECFITRNIEENTVIPVQGGRYDVHMKEKLKKSVYYDNLIDEYVCRASWFYSSSNVSSFECDDIDKDTVNQNLIIPFDETSAEHLEITYQSCKSRGQWNEHIVVSPKSYTDTESSTTSKCPVFLISFFSKRVIMMHVTWIDYQQRRKSCGKWDESEILNNDSLNLDLIKSVRFQHNLDEWGQVKISGLVKDSQDKKLGSPSIVYRGVESLPSSSLPDGGEFPDGESVETPDHLTFVVHGIGEACDIKLRSIHQVVDNYRILSNDLSQKHFQTSHSDQTLNRIEFLPINWHTALHSGPKNDTDEKLSPLTLKSIPMLRCFVNETLADILLYTSPSYAQGIVDRVVFEMNRLHDTFILRYPSFTGQISVIGHSLGSLITFDILSHQKAGQENCEPQKSITGDTEGEMKFGPAGTGQQYVRYPSLKFRPSAFFALGSPISLFMTVRGVDKLDSDFRLPTCPRFYNIFHPFDPVAYRIESLIDRKMQDKSPVTIPHHMGRKRMHLEIFDRLSSLIDSTQTTDDVTQKISQTLSSVYNFAIGGGNNSQSSSLLSSTSSSCSQDLQNVASNTDLKQISCCDFAASLNQGKRIDYVLQEAPLESINEYLFALASHLCYWSSEDTALMIIKDVYENDLAGGPLQSNTTATTMK